MFDGHNGARASHFGREHLIDHVLRQMNAVLSMRDVVGAADPLAAVERHMKRIVIDAFKSCDDEFLAQAAVA